MVTDVTVSSGRNAIPLLVGYIGDAVVGDHRNPRVRHTAVDVEAGTEGACHLSVGLRIPTRVVRTGLTGREDHRRGIGCVVDAHALRGEGHALDLTGRVENPKLGLRSIAGVDHHRAVAIRAVET